jgi:hypothetical protein
MQQRRTRLDPQPVQFVQRASPPALSGLQIGDAIVEQARTEGPAGPRLHMDEVSGLDARRVRELETMNRLVAVAPWLPNASFMRSRMTGVAADAAGAVMRTATTSSIAARECRLEQPDLNGNDRLGEPRLNILYAKILTADHRLRRDRFGATLRDARHGLQRKPWGGLRSNNQAVRSIATAALFDAGKDRLLFRRSR